MKEGRGLTGQNENWELPVWRVGGAQTVAPSLPSLIPLGFRHSLIQKTSMKCLGQPGAGDQRRISQASALSNAVGLALPTGVCAPEELSLGGS